MKDEYIRIIDGDPTRKAIATTKKISDLEYEIVEFDIPVDYIEIGEELLKEITADADNEGITLKVDIDKILPDK
jgi:hypothetical protein